MFPKRVGGKLREEKVILDSSLVHPKKTARNTNHTGSVSAELLFFHPRNQMTTLDSMPPHTTLMDTL